MLRVLTTASSPVEQSLLLARLSDAGIPCMRGAGGARAALGSGRDILVEDEDLARAKEILKEDDEGFDEGELVRLSEEAGRQAADAGPPLSPEDRAGQPTPVEAHSPAKTHGFLKAFERLTGKKDEAKRRLDIHLGARGCLARPMDRLARAQHVFDGMQAQ
jgi:hypothetical protein